MSDISSLFSAKSIAVIGASANPQKLGHLVLKNIIEGGFKGKIYPVNQKGGTVLGMSCYKSLKETGGVPDLIVVIVPNWAVPATLKEAGELGVRNAIIISGGFGEVGNNDLEEEIIDIAQQYSIRILGPNCQGLIYNPNSLCASWPLISANGGMAVISQSGTIGAEIGIRAQDEGLGVSGIVSLGNKTDINELDLIEFFANDPNTASIALYIEGLKDGKRFIDLARRMGSKKPLVILKPGRSEAGREAVASHTCSLSGKSEVFEGLCKQYGLLNAKSVTELYDLLKGLSCIQPAEMENVVIVTSSGGSGILAADECAEAGLNLVRLTSDTVKEIKEHVPEHCVIKNPIDLTGDATALMYENVISKAAKDPNVDTFLVIFGDPIPGVGEAMCRLKDQIKQKLIICFLGGGDVQVEETVVMHRSGIPVYPSPERAVNVIKRIVEHSKISQEV